MLEFTGIMNAGADSRSTATHMAGGTVQSEPVLIGTRWLWFVILSIALGVATVFFTYTWITAFALSGGKAIVLSLTAVVGLATANFAAKWIVLLRMRRPIPLSPPEGLRIAAVTTYVPGSESIEMIEVTLTAMTAMKYPHDCWLLDEGDTEEAKILCRHLGVFYYSRKNRHDHQAEAGSFQSRSKHGNYNSWLTAIGFHGYDIIAGFDPDHIPSEDYLAKTLGYFSDQRIGYVQSAQAYYNQSASFISAGAAEETYDYYSVMQMAAYGSGFPVVIGSHNIHRVTALRQVGGFAAHDADDLLITILYRTAGWEGVYVPAILARGLAPVDWQGYLTQQRRWARAVLDVRLRLNRSLMVRLPRQTVLASYVPVLSYLQPSIMLLLVLWIALNTIAEGAIPAFLTNLNLSSTSVMAIVLINCYFFRQTFYLDPQREWGMHMRARLMRLAKAPFLLLACFDVLLGRRFEYALTVKTRQKIRRNLLLMPFGIIACLVAITWIFGTAQNALYSPAAHLLAGVLFILCLGLVVSGHMPVPEPFDLALVKSASSR